MQYFLIYPCKPPGRILFCIFNTLLLAVLSRVERFTEDSVVYADGTKQKVDVVVMATGYNADFSYVDCPSVQGKQPIHGLHDMS